MIGNSKVNRGFEIGAATLPYGCTMALRSLQVGAPQCVGRDGLEGLARLGLADEETWALTERGRALASELFGDEEPPPSSRRPDPDDEPEAP